MVSSPTVINNVRFGRLSSTRKEKRKEKSAVAETRSVPATVPLLGSPLRLVADGGDGYRPRKVEIGPTGTRAGTVPKASRSLVSPPSFGGALEGYLVRLPRWRRWVHGEAKRERDTEGRSEVDVDRGDRRDWVMLYTWFFVPGDRCQLGVGDESIPLPMNHRRSWYSGSDSRPCLPSCFSPPVAIYTRFRGVMFHCCAVLGGRKGFRAVRPIEKLA